MIRHIEYAGYELVADDTDDIGGDVVSGDVWEPEVREIISEYVTPGDLVVDVGANIGTHTLEFRRAVGSGGDIIAVEPHPETYELLSKTIQRNAFGNVYPVQIAISDRVEMVELTEMRHNDSGMVTTMDIEQRDDDTKTYTVMSIPLSKLVTPEHVVDFLKLDIEGAEVNVVPSLDFDQYETILMEFHPFTYDDGDRDELIETFNEHGSVRVFGRDLLWTK